MLVVSRIRDLEVNLKITDFGTSKATTRSAGTYSSPKEIEEMKKRLHGSSITSGSSYAFTPSNNNNNTNNTNTHTTNTSNSLISSHQSTARNTDSQRPLSHTDRVITKGVGTLIYQAPEILEGRQEMNIAKTDVYSYGVMLWQIFVGREPYREPPYDKFSKWDLENFVISGKRLPIPNTIPPPVRVLIDRCWQHDPAARPEFKEIEQILEKIYQTFPPEPANNHHSYTNINNNNNNNNNNHIPNIQMNHNNNTNVSISVNTPNGGQPPSPRTSSNMSHPSPGSNGSTPTGGSLVHHSNSSNNNNSSNGNNNNNINNNPNTSNTLDPSSARYNNSSVMINSAGGIKKGAPTIPEEKHNEIGYFGELSRVETESRLAGQPNGTFILRWSANTDSFVLSYLKNASVLHIAYIRLGSTGTIIVDKEGGGTCEYKNITDYLESMKKNGVISKPLLPKPVKEDIYGFSC
jgi:hypothetical protein